MSHKRKKKKHNSSGGASTVDLNVMPFVDIFSLLTTFLLFSAVFVQIGILEVQVPFLSNAAPPPDEKPTRSISVQVDVQNDKLSIESKWSAPPEDKQTFDFEHNDAGITELHAKLLDIRISSPENDKLTMFVDDDVSYNKVAQILDAIKLLKEGDRPIPSVAGESLEAAAESTSFLYRKVIMGSVML